MPSDFGPKIMIRFLPTVVIAPARSYAPRKAATVIGVVSATASGRLSAGASGLGKVPGHAVSRHLHSRLDRSLEVAVVERTEAQNTNMNFAISDQPMSGEEWTKRYATEH